jgi:hypothetical protein
MLCEILGTKNVNSVLNNAKKKSLSPIDISLAYLVQLRLRTSIYTKFTSFEAIHVLRNF